MNKKTRKRQQGWRERRMTKKCRINKEGGNDNSEGGERERERRGKIWRNVKENEKEINERGWIMKNIKQE